ncbi:hypothetical protein GX50_00062 [[Emmonsia] crescens]|uniref:Uncharacterized protein n=1 Tax=[Emmonsia] crescens TaxID=73230 RepID=A0A2B7ZV47_9EURO|nr:hypothetical protein GX50_00062 [Emmonsia crescens]
MDVAQLVLSASSLGITWTLIAHVWSRRTTTTTIRRLRESTFYSSPIPAAHPLVVLRGISYRGYDSAKMAERSPKYRQEIQQVRLEIPFVLGVCEVRIWSGPPVFISNALSGNCVPANLKNYIKFWSSQENPVVRPPIEVCK